MDRGKRKGNILGMTNNKIYMDLKDIIREHALAYLPAKSLMRCQSVCRDWKIQIATPFFAHNQSLRGRSVSGLFCQAAGQPPFFVSFDPKSCGVPDPLLNFLPEPVEIRSSSNGLLCCQSSSSERAYYICNPVTKQWKKLPKPNADHGPYPAIVIVFEPSLLNFEAEYKLVCAFRSNDFDDAIEFEVYNSVEDSWNISGEICFKTGTPVPSAAVHVNNVVYWRLDCGSLLAFDLIKDRSQRLYGSSGTLGDMHGKLCLAGNSGGSIYMSVLANVHTNTMQIYNKAKMWQGKQVVLKNLAADADRKVVFVGGDILVVQSLGTLYLSNLKDNETKRLRELDEHGKMSFVPYVNSLVCI